MAIWLTICHTSMRTHFGSTEPEKKNGREEEERGAGWRGIEKTKEGGKEGGEEEGKEGGRRGGKKGWREEGKGSI